MLSSEGLSPSVPVTELLTGALLQICYVTLASRCLQASEK